MHSNIFFFSKREIPPPFLCKNINQTNRQILQKITKIPRGTGLVYQLNKGGKQLLKLLQKNVKIGFGVGGYPGFWTVPPGMIYDENILMLYWWFAICVIYVMEFEDNLEFSSNRKMNSYRNCWNSMYVVGNKLEK